MPVVSAATMPARPALLPQSIPSVVGAFVAPNTRQSASVGRQPLVLSRGQVVDNGDQVASLNVTSAVPLTINTNRLGDLMLPGAYLDGLAVDEARVLYRQAFDKAHNYDLPGRVREPWCVRANARNRLLTIVHMAWIDSVEACRTRGGLLHVGVIGAPA